MNLNLQAPGLVEQLELHANFFLSQWEYAGGKILKESCIWVLQAHRLF